MQVTERQQQILCFAAAVAKCSSAIHNMEQMVMFPSLLRDVPLEPDTSTAHDTTDMYEYYILLKSIKASMENGLIPLEEWKSQMATVDKEAEVVEAPNLEALFYAHFSGLLQTLNCFTKKANTLTKRYKDLIGMAH
ncbi:thyroid hormone-inducible hepatic protein [Microcaecilia unicolor]|uniref:Thyroid hormone-inducible hepatic protein n=1 Tax=Microcaecilia unicolor TaxID=1415580 RepID=A0A6P7XPX6_9AMPH|nr:thyroid hormone-inducible hepatic protein [Microcaecilia unicolor]